MGVVNVLSSYALQTASTTSSSNRAMSRAPPFPTRRRSPSASNGSPYQSPPVSAPGTTGTTRPLQISRPVSSRPTTPVGSYPSGSPSYSNVPTTIGPSRPQRSERRARPDYTGSDRGSTVSQDTYNRDSVSTSRSDIPSSYRPVPHNIVTNNGPPPINRPPRLLSPVSDDGNTPTSLTSALTAFQSAGTKRRQQSEDNDDYLYKKEREEEIEAEKARQQRIRDKAPGMRNRGNARGGEIDGTSRRSIGRITTHVHLSVAVLDQVKDGWEFVIDPDVRYAHPGSSNIVLTTYEQFNSVDLALQLLDKSSMGKDIESFRRTKNMLSKALKGSVDSRC